MGGGEGAESLIPVAPATILSTDIAAQRITVRLPEGLLPDGPADSDQELD